MTTLVEDRQQRIQTLESLLECEKNNCTELHQKLNVANEDLFRRKRKKEMSDQNYSEALDKVKEFKALYQQSEEKIKKMEAELASMRTSVSQAENVVNRRMRRYRCLKAL